MTLLVGAVFPWRDLIRQMPVYDILPRLQGGGVIIAADSRWTHPDGRVEDGAVKVFGLGKNGVMGYAGPAGAGENALSALAQEVRRTTTMEEFTSDLSQIIRQATIGDELEGLEVLVGFTNMAGNAALIRLRSADDFRPTFPDVAVIGPRAAVDYFEQTLRAAPKEIARESGSGSVPIDVRTWASLFMAFIDEIVRFRLDYRVGGGIICAASTRGVTLGAGTLSVSMEGGTLKARELSLPTDTAKTVKVGWQYVDLPTTTPPSTPPTP